jgi:hypothetical protein
MLFTHAARPRHRFGLECRYLYFFSDSNSELILALFSFVDCVPKFIEVVPIHRPGRKWLVEIN